MISSVNAFAARWLEYFSYAIVQNTVFLGCIFVTLYLLRRTNARLKYAIGILGMIKLLVPPFLPASFGTAETTIPAVVTIDMNMTMNVVPAEPVAPQFSFASLLFLLWCAILLIYFLSLLLSTARLKWRLRKSSFIKSLFVDDVFIDLYQSSRITVPMSIGIHPSRIYVPDSWCELLSAQQESLLRHEVAHIQRWDGLFHILQVIAQAIYFFHPLVWLLNARINDYREMACDDVAVERSAISSLMYSRCLVHIAESMKPAWSCSSASALIKQRNKLYHRVNYQVAESTKQGVSKRRVGLIWIVLFGLFVSLSWTCEGEQSDNLSQRGKAKLAGVIQEHGTEKPLEGVLLAIDGCGQAATDENGYYAFDRIPAGDFVLKARYQNRTYDSHITLKELPEFAPLLAKYGHMTINMHLNLKEYEHVPDIVVEAPRYVDEPNSKIDQLDHSREHESQAETDSRFEIIQATDSLEAALKLQP